MRLGALAAGLLTLVLLATACTDDGGASAVTEPVPTVPGDATANATHTTSHVQVEGVVDFSDVVQEVHSSVVLIESVGASAGVSGSGVVIDQEGHILTNFHVVQGQSSLKVSLPDGSAALATVVGTDPANDLAVIQASGFDPADLRPAGFGDSDEVRVGQPVFAIGSPFEQKFTVTSGIISATGRTSNSAFARRPIHDVLQTDAALNPGNSGGPLFNLAGEVIGINTSIENPEGRVFAGIGFAVPSNTVRRFLPAMLAGEDIQHPQLGVQTDDLDRVIAQQQGLAVDRGVLVGFVQPGSAAERAGVRAGDVIVGVNGRPVTRFEDLARAVDLADVGDEVTVLVSRAGAEVALTAQLQPWDLN
ncbi:MAG: trypsin-like peptidase domain-containing protein [Dehalococcoidia bacterium]|nr:trypsin-like peptidase domain-containing protein [Dehalococcoidia bacterium]